MQARQALRDRVNVHRTVLAPFVVNGETRYRLTIEHGLGCRSEFVFDAAGLAAHIRQLSPAAASAAGHMMGETA